MSAFQLPLLCRGLLARSLMRILPKWGYEAFHDLLTSLTQVQSSVAKTNRLPQSALGRSNYVAMSRPAAEEQFLEQNAWANPRHPSHTQNTGQLSRQVSTHERPKDIAMTPAHPRNATDQPRPAGSASTIPDLASAQPSSAITIPYAETEASGQRRFGFTNHSGNQDEVPVADQSQIQQDRHQSVSPSENRRHAHALADSASRATRPVAGLADAGDRPSSEFLGQARGGLFRTSSGPDLISRNDQGAHLMDTSRINSSSLSLHQHPKDSALTPIAGLSKIGAR